MTFSANSRPRPMWKVLSRHGFRFAACQSLRICQRVTLARANTPVLRWVASRGARRSGTGRAPRRTGTSYWRPSAAFEAVPGRGNLPQAGRGGRPPWTPILTNGQRATARGGFAMTSRMGLFSSSSAACKGGTRGWQFADRIGVPRRRNSQALRTAALPLDRPGPALVIAALLGAMMTSCSSGRQPVRSPAATTPHPRTVQVHTREPFSVGIVPTVPVPIGVGTHLAFRLSSTTAGYANLYLLDPVGQVSVLAENMPLAAGNLTYPSPVHGFTLEASQPVGLNRVILLVTRQPFRGFSGDATLTTPVALALHAREFLTDLNRATARLSRASWVMDEIQIRVVG